MIQTVWFSSWELASLVNIQIKVTVVFNSYYKELKFCQDHYHQNDRHFAYNLVWWYGSVLGKSSLPIQS